MRFLIAFLICLPTFAGGYQGNIPEDGTVGDSFNTFTSAFALVAPSSAFAPADIAVYKSSSGTPKATTNGITVTSPVNSETGVHAVEIDTSNDTGDVGWWLPGEWYTVKLNTAKTVDSVSVDGVILFTFSIEDRWNEVDVIKWLGTAASTPTTPGVPEVDIIAVNGTSVTTPSSVDANVTQWNGTNVLTPDTAGAPKVTVKDGTGTGEIDTLSGSIVNVDLVDTATTVTNGVSVGTGAITYTQLSDPAKKILYAGPRGPGIYIDDDAANTSTTYGLDGTPDNPVSTIGAAVTLAASLGNERIYLINSDITLGATMEDFEFVGIGDVFGNIVNLGSQDVDRTSFINLVLEGTQGGTERIQAIDCALQDPGPGDSTFNIFAVRCGIVDRIQVDTSADNVFDQCFSLVAGTAAPIIDATGAAGTMAIRHFSGGIEFESLSASHNVSVETDGQVIFAADCNVNATVAIRGNATITDNTGGMAAISDDARFDVAQNIGVNWSDISGTLDAAEIGTDAITAAKIAADAIGTSEASALATAAAQTTAQNDLDIITDTDGVILGAAGIDLIWDEALTKLTHDVPNSAAKKIQQLTSNVAHSGTAQGPGTGTNQLQLAADASPTAGAYDPGLVFLEGGTGAGQVGVILEYNESTKTVTLERDWKTAPDATTDYIVFADRGDGSVNEGLLVAATSTTAKLNALASSASDTYNSQLLWITSGLGADQAIRITDYDGPTQTITIEHPFSTTPNTTSAYRVIPFPDSHDAWTALTAEHTDVGSFGANLQNAVTAGGDATLANQTDLIDKVKGIMSKDHTLATAVGTFDPATDSNEAIRENMTGSGSGDTRVTKDFGTGQLYWKQTDLTPITDADVRVYVASVYDTGVYSLIAFATTGDDGGPSDVWLNTGLEYVFEYTKDGYPVATERITP